MLDRSLVNYKQSTVPKVFVTRLFEASNRPSDLVSASNPDKVNTTMYSAKKYTNAMIG